MVLNVGHDGGTSAHFEDRSSDPMLTTAPRPLLFQIEIFVKVWCYCLPTFILFYFILFIYLFFFVFFFYPLINTSKSNISSPKILFVQCQHFKTNVFFQNRKNNTSLMTFLHF